MEENTMPKPKQATAYSYIRFSHPDQAKGDSLRRQTAKRDAWLKKTGAVLDTALSLQDKGVSAFTGEHRANPERHALAAFLELVKQGRIAKGSYLIVESLDRLSREHIRPALTLLLNLIDAGVRVVQLLPVEATYDERVEPMQLMMAIMELSRGNSESQLKSERVGDAWQTKKRVEATNGHGITARTPAWLRAVKTEQNGSKHKQYEFQVIESAAESIRQIFRWAIDGHGLGVITKKLNAADVPTISTGRAAKDFWPRSYVAKILANPAVIGQYQPYTGRGRKRKPDGEPIPDYYPAIVSEQDFYAARAALANRRNKAGRIGKACVNVFANLLHDARDGGTFLRVNKGKKGSGVALAPYKATQGVGKYVAFPFDVFERAVLSCLREIDPGEILPKKDRSGEKVLALSGKLQEVQDRITRIRAKLMEAPDIESVIDTLRELDENRKAIEIQLLEARQEAASPLMEAWGQVRSLIDVLDSVPDPEETRVRLRAAIRRIVESVWLLVVRRGSTRLAAVQVWFAGDRKYRDYLILHKAAVATPEARKPSICRVRSLADVVKSGGMDLRDRKHAAALEKILAGVPLELLSS
jgi:DNA invertase Pin-like site-specific DNA recombinase